MILSWFITSAKNVVQDSSKQTKTSKYQLKSCMPLNLWMAIIPFNEQVYLISQYRTMKNLIDLKDYHQIYLTLPYQSNIIITKPIMSNKLAIFLSNQISNSYCQVYLVVYNYVIWYLSLAESERINCYKFITDYLQRTAMSYLLKITYQHKHKKYRYHPDRPVNFNQIRNQFGITHLTPSLLYLVKTSDLSFSRGNTSPEHQQLAFREQQFANYLKTVTLSTKEMLKIKVISQEEKQVQQSLCDFQGETDELSQPTKLQTVKSRSEEIDLDDKRKGSTSNTIEITQSFICSSLLYDVKTSKSKYMQQLEQQLMRNAMRMKLNQQKRRYTKIDKIYQYLSSAN